MSDQDLKQIGKPDGELEEANQRNQLRANLLNESRSKIIASLILLGIGLFGTKISDWYSLTPSQAIVINAGSPIILMLGAFILIQAVISYFLSTKC